MRRLLFLLIVLLSGSALDALPAPLQVFKPAEEVPPQCADPTYACQDLENARQCRVVKSCANDVWATMSAPEDEDDICTLCKEMVKEARDQLLSNMTQEELKEVFEGSCKLLHFKLIVDPCIKLVDEFMVELVEMLASRMDPNMVCTVSGLCNLAHLPIEEHLMNLLKFSAVNMNTDQCDQCVTIMTEAKSFVTGMSEDNFKDMCKKLCEEAEGAVVCTMVIDSYGHEIYEFLINSDPKTVCTSASLCPSVNHIIKVPLEKKNVNDDLVCQFCTNVLEHVREEIVANTTREEFKTALLNFCTHLGKLSNECKSVVNDYYDMIFDFLDKLDTKSVCTLIGLCQSGVHNNRISPLVKLFPAETLPKHTKMVRLTASLPVKTKLYAQPMVKLVPAKTVSKKDFRIAADIESNDIFGNVAKYQLPAERLAIPLISIDRNLDCPFCRAVTFFLEKDLGNDRSRDGVTKAMSAVCDKWVKEFPEECKSFLKKYSDHVVNHITENGDFDLLCSHIKACHLEGKDTGVNVKVIAPVSAPTDEICDLCKKIFDEAESLVKNPDFQNSIRRCLEQGCQLCPAKQKCISVIDQNINKLFAVIEKNLQSGVACPALHLCPAESKVHLSPLKNVECDFCKDLIQQLVNELQDPGTKESLKALLEKGCSLLPEKLSGQCKTFVEEHYDAIIQIITNVLNPDVVCAAMNICPDSEKFVKPPKKNDLECDLCKEVVQKVEDQIKDKKTEEAIKQALEKVCDYLPGSMSDKCKSFVANYTETLIILLLQEVNPDVVCAELKLCADSEKLVKPPKKNDLECDLCKEVVQNVEDQIKDKKTEEAIKQALEKVCDYLPSSMSDKCKSFVANYTGTLITLLLQEMDPDTVCAELKLCPASTKIRPPINGISCDVCEEGVKLVENFLKNKKAEDAIRNALDEVCSILPSSLSSHCHGLVNTYLELFISLLAQAMDPTMVCAAFDVCPRQDLECEGCQYMFHYIQEQLADNDTQDELKNVLKKFCGVFPQTYADNCDAFVDEYGSSFFMLIAQELDPSVVCPKLGMCPSTEKYPQKVFQPTNIKSLVSDECTICTSVVEYLDKLLEDDNVDKEITNVIEKVCNVVPTSVKDKCSSIVETYGPYILQMIGQIADSKQVCQDIDLCSRPPGHVHLLGGHKCTFGPSYWCQSKAHATACKAEMFCSQKIWKN